MSKELEFLTRHVAMGRLSRRDFLGRAAALGVTAPFANMLLSGAAMAQSPVKGGILKAGLQGRRGHQQPRPGDLPEPGSVLLRQVLG